MYKKEIYKLKQAINFIQGIASKRIIGKKGFTLIEMLLVMAIISILAGTIMVGMSSTRKRARVTSALKTANGVTAELAHCYLNNKTVISPTNTQDGGGGQICQGAGNYPKLAKGCVYNGYSGNKLKIDCTNNGGVIITCDVVKGKCSK